MKKIVFCMLTVILFIGCSSQNDDAISTGRELIGQWDLVEILNGPRLPNKEGNVTRYPSGSVIVEFMTNGMCVLLHHTGEQEVYDYTFPKDLENYHFEWPVVLLDDVPFGYTIEGDVLKMLYGGLATTDHIPATFVLKRLN